jgi:small subunit ribosomal protein S16
MAVKIRLSRAGKKHVPFHRVVVVDSRKKRDGEVLDTIGTYDAIKGSIIKFNEELYLQWLGKGAQATDSAKKIFKQFKRTDATATQVQPKAKKATKAVAKVAPTSQAEVTEPAADNKE